MDSHINNAVAHHLYRQGHYATAERFSQEAGLAHRPEHLRDFKTMREILEAIRERNLAPAIRCERGRGYGRGCHRRCLVG